MYIASYVDSSNGDGAESPNPRCMIPVVESDDTIGNPLADNKHEQLKFFDPNFIFSDNARAKSVIKLSRIQRLLFSFHINMIQLYYYY